MNTTANDDTSTNALLTTEQAGGMCGPARLFLAMDALLFILFMIQVFSFAYVGAEDAYISYRVARNAARGAGFVYTPGEYVESISNPLWTSALSLCYWLGLDIPWAGLALMTACSVCFFFVLRHAACRLFGQYAWLARFPLVMAVCATHLPIGFGNMLEGSAVALAAALIAWFAITRQTLGLAFTAMALMLLRPEGPLYAVGIGIWLVFEAWRGRFSWLSMWRYMALTASMLLTIELARMHYFGDIVPNTVRAKVLPSAGGFHLADTGLMRFYFSYIGPAAFLLGAAAFIDARRRALATLFCILLTINLAPAFGSGDWLMYRLFTPFLPYVALLAAFGMEAVNRRRRWAGKVAVFLGGVALFWVVEPSPLLERLPFFSGPFSSLCHPKFVESKYWETAAPCPLTAHIANLDFGWPDDRVIVECGGGIGWDFDGVTITEMWGLADRDLVLGLPQMQRHMIFGTRNWPRIVAKHPTCYLFACVAYNIEEMLTTPGLESALDEYVVFRDFTASKQPLLIIRADREVCRKGIVDYGQCFPAPDFRTCGISNSDDALTAWQKIPWTEECGKTCEDSWEDWGNRQRFGAKFLPVETTAEGDGTLSPHTEQRTMHRRLLDNSPVVVLLGIPPGSDAFGQVHAAIRTSSETLAETTVELRRDPTGFTIVSVALDAPTARENDSLELSIPTALPAPLWVAAHRWPRNMPVPLPSPFSDSIPPGAPDLSTSSGEQNTPEDLVQRKNMLFYDAHLARERLRAHPDSEPVRERLRAFYLEHNAPEESLLEWEEMSRWFPEKPWMWMELAFAGLNANDIAKAAMASQEVWHLTLYDSPCRASLLECLETTARSWLEAGRARDAAELCLRIDALEPGRLDTFETLTTAMAATGNDFQRLGLLRELVSQFPVHYPGFEQLSGYYLKTGDLDGLLQEWSGYTVAHPDAHLGWFSLGLAYERRHEYNKAAEAYRHALTLNPDARGTREALERVLKK